MRMRCAAFLRLWGNIHGQAVQVRATAGRERIKSEVWGKRLKVKCLHLYWWPVGCSNHHVLDMMMTPSNALTLELALGICFSRIIGPTDVDQFTRDDFSLNDA